MSKKSRDISHVGPSVLGVEVGGKVESLLGINVGQVCCNRRG